MGAKKVETRLNEQPFLGHPEGKAALVTVYPVQGYRIPLILVGPDVPPGISLNVELQILRLQCRNSQEKKDG